MTKGLVRYQQTGDFHFVTFSCYGRLPHLGSDPARSLFERSLEAIRARYDFAVIGYVVMPEHVHLLVSEPKRAILRQVALVQFPPLRHRHDWNRRNRVPVDCRAP
jgi:putative transposase